MESRRNRCPAVKSVEFVNRRERPPRKRTVHDCVIAVGARHGGELGSLVTGAGKRCRGMGYDGVVSVEVASDG